MTMDLHADQIQGFFEVPVDHLFASTIFVPYIQSLGLERLTIASPDIGGARMANAYARFLNAEVVICYKHREKPNEISKLMLIGEVKDKNVILVDDIVDTAGTISKAADMQLTRNLAIELGPSNIRVNCISSGGILDKQPEIFLKKYQESCTSKGMLNSEDLCGALLFLLSNQSQFVNGQNIIVDDGWSL